MTPGQSGSGKSSRGAYSNSRAHTGDPFYLGVMAEAQKMTWMTSQWASYPLQILVAQQKEVHLAEALSTGDGCFVLGPAIAAEKV